MIELDILVFLFISIFGWIDIFLWHEFSHIKSQGIKSDGKINIDGLSMTATTNLIKYPELFWLSGGLYSGILFLLISLILFHYGIWSFYIPLSTFSVVNISYGFWEWLHGPEGRYKLYVVVIFCMMLFWLAWWLVL